MNELLPQMKLLPYRYKRHGLWVLIAGIPTMALLSIGLIEAGIVTERKAFFAEWNDPMVYYPIIIGMALLVFSEEKEEDEMVQNLRYKAFVSGVFFLVIGILWLPFFTNIMRTIRGEELAMSDVGGHLGALMLLLFYTYGSFRYNLYRTRKELETDAE